MFLKHLGVVLNNYLSSEYEYIILLGDFDLTTPNKYLADFMTLFNPESLINTPCCISLILTNKKSLFKKFEMLKVGMSDHHHLV